MASYFGYITSYSGSTPFYAVVFVFLVVTLVFKRFSVVAVIRRFFGSNASTSIDAIEASVDDPSSELMSYFSTGNSVNSAGRGKLNGMTWSAYFTSELDPVLKSPTQFAPAGTLIYQLDLPFNTQTHLVGLSKQFGIDRVQLESFLYKNGMEKVVLEGDFPDYFDIYATKGQQFQARFVLNPDAMAFVVDFCRSHFWEIGGSELYFAVTDKDPNHDNVISESQSFVEHIKPALLPGDPGAAKVNHPTPYGEYDGPELPCPICKKSMPIRDNWLRCEEHGTLMSARDLIKLHSGELKITDATGPSADHLPLKCPGCHGQMVLVNYEGTGVSIDSCETCPFRWLDAGEITAINNKSSRVAI